jgi:hypothetical protein
VAYHVSIDCVSTDDCVMSTIITERNHHVDAVYAGVRNLDENSGSV